MNTSNQAPQIVGISGISGSGKSTLVKKLAELLNATSLFWDDFDEISRGPEDYVKWYASSRNYDEWLYPALAKTLERLKKGHIVLCPATKKELRPTQYIFFDAPLGYCHRETGKYIDFLICLDTPLDIALARRLLRERSEAIFDELEFYLIRSRPLFILTPEEKMCDLLVDGHLSVEEQCKKILNVLQKNSQDPTPIEIKMQPLSDKLRKRIYDGFSRHAIATTGYDEKFDPVAFVATDSKGNFAGAIVAELFWGALHIKYVYVEEEYRNHGIATSLMESVLKYGKEQGCAFVFVETMSFQAMEFYKKMGFELEFSRSGYKLGTSFNYLRKDI